MMLKPTPQSIKAPLRMRLLASLLAGLGGCAAVPPPILPLREPTAMDMVYSGSTALVAVPAPAASAASAAAAGAQVPSAAASAVPIGRTPRLFETPPPPRPGASTALPSPAGTPMPDDPALETAVALTQLPLPVFIDTVFATILKRNISVDPAVAQRKEFVSLKSGKPQTASQLYEAAKAVLKSYGIAVIEYNGLVRVTASAGSAGFVPEVRRGRSLPDVPAALRPVFQIVDLEAVSPASVAGWLRTVFGQRLLVQEDVGNQAILISGQSDDVAAGIETIRVLDQPTMRGRSSARIAPLFWSADEMAKRLAEIMQAQGYAVGTAAAAQAPIILLPVPPLNSVLVFARSDAVLNHVLRWATELDQPASGRGSAGYFTYPVRNLDAAALAKTLQEVMNPTAAAGGAAAAGSVRSRVVVNASSNTLIIQGSPTEYQQWFGLLQELDRPPRSAMVSVTIAEVKLNNGEQLGFEWLLNEFKLGNLVVNLSTLGAFGTTGIGGLAAVITKAGNTTARAVLNALASTSRVRVLANPTVMARNGEAAMIQVGSEVPVVSAQQTTGGSTVAVPGGDLQPNVLQTIQYRQTGVILKVRPVIHAGGRIDLDVEQEVSSASATKTGVSASPTISTRRVSTKLSVVDGATVLLGGLMTETASNADTGVPLLKDIPYAGTLFRSSDNSRDRTELVMLITPYVIADEFEARAMSDAFRGQFMWDASTPMQNLRPQRAVAPASTPRGAIEDAGSTPKPYVLPPADAPTAVPPAGASGTRGGATPALGARPNFSSVATQPAAASAPAAPATSPARPGGPSAAPAGTPVTDPELLKELQNATKAR
jgi:general secretion pathway protein D